MAQRSNFGVGTSLRAILAAAALATIAVLPAAALAGDPPPACTNWMASDLVVFAEGMVGREVIGRADSSSTCTDVDGDLKPELSGNVFVEFGPYQVTGCNGPDAIVQVPFSGQELLEGAGQPNGEKTYVPAIASLEIHGAFGTALRANCVAATNLDYRVFDVAFSGAAGARTGDPAAGEASSVLHLPLSVRAEDATGFRSTIELGPFALAQDMTFLHQVELGPASALRLWPDGLPFRIGPFRLTFTAVEFRMSTHAVLGPAPYAFAAPPWLAGNKGFPVGCDPNKPDALEACTGSGTVANDAYLDAPWQPQGEAIVDLDGMSLELSLSAGFSLIYETLFPRGTWILLQPPAALTVTDGRIGEGFFQGGAAWLRRESVDLCALTPPERRFTFEGGALKPTIGADGNLLAGIVDLEEGPTAAALPVDWGIHTATGLGCGTLYVPPATTGANPQQTWNASRVPAVLDRGIYAGVNYNRNRVCRDAGGQPLEATCTVDADCDTGAGESCVDGGFSPLCPALPGAHQPFWNTRIDDVPHAFQIDPDAPGQGDREMAFVLRGSGVTGIFDGGDDDFVIQNPGNPPSDPPGFEYAFTRYGLAYRQDRTTGADTIVSGAVKFPWPAQTEIPIPEMKICSCGQPDGGRTPEFLVKNTLDYWDADFFPYGVNFINGQAANASCSEQFASVCDDLTTDPNDTAVIQAKTPIPRMRPEPDSCFTVDTAGKPAEFTPISAPQLEFDESVPPGPSLPPYRFDVDYFTLSDWPVTDPLASCQGSVQPGPVHGGSCPYGSYDVSGEIAVPYFGSTPAGLLIQPQDRNLADGMGPTYFPVNLHEKGDVHDPAVTVQRVIAGNSVPVTYRLDYFTPDVTADPTDGSEEVTINGHGLGRGKLFAFADESAQSLGATKVAGAMIMTPEGGVHHGQADLGPAAAMRLWGAVEPSWRLVRLPSIMSIGLLQPGLGGQYDSAFAQLGLTAHDLPAPSTLGQQLRDSGVIDTFDGHPDAEIAFEVGDPGLSPPVIGRRTVGHIQFDPAQEQVEWFDVISDQSTGGRFYAFDASRLRVERQVKDSGMPITTLDRIEVPGAKQSMSLPGEQEIPFPLTSGARGSSFGSGIQWDYDYDVDTSGPLPQFTFKSLTGTMDLTKGGLSGLGFDKMSATLGFYADGDWYFNAGLKVTWSGYGASGDVLFGNTKDMTPLRKIDPLVAGFLKGIERFEGAYVRVGLRASLVDFGCLLRLGAGAEVAGWYLDDSFGGKLRGYIFGDGACLVSVHGDMTLVGGEVDDVFKFLGSFWVAGGIGFCDEEDWDTPSDVLDDDFCAACVLRLKLRGRYPPSDLDLRVSGPRVSCSL